MKMVPAWLIFTYAACLVPALVGFWFIVYRPPFAGGVVAPDDGANPNAPWPRLVRLRAELATATRLVIGLSLLIGAYHIAAYASPDDWIGFKIPKDRWYILVAWIVFANLGTYAAEKLEAASDTR